MLSKIDIENELGKGINIVPFNHENIKENSINLSTSSYAWTMSDGEIFIKNNEITLNSTTGKKIKLAKGESAVININKTTKIVLLPFSTTLIETNEVMAVTNNIGGTYHSKVGLVSQGLGHIGTMLGPNYSGHSLIAIHNVSEKLLTLDIGETFVSIVFHYLNTPINSANPTSNGHLDKMSELGIKLNTADRRFLGEDWKSNLSLVCEKMNCDKNFNEFKNILNSRKYETIKKYINIRNICISIIIIAVFSILGFLANYADSKLTKPIWVDRFWTVGFSGILVTLLNYLLKLIKPKQ